jgi:hypothetical protein
MVMTPKGCSRFSADVSRWPHESAFEEIAGRTRVTANTRYVVSRSVKSKGWRRDSETNDLISLPWVPVRRFLWFVVTPRSKPLASRRTYFLLFSSTKLGLAIIPGVSDDPLPPWARRSAEATLLGHGFAVTWAFLSVPACAVPAADPIEKLLTASCVAEERHPHHRQHLEIETSSGSTANSTLSGSGTLTPQPSLAGAGYISQLGPMGLAGLARGAASRRVLRPPS